MREREKVWEREREKALVLFYLSLLHCFVFNWLSLKNINQVYDCICSFITRFVRKLFAKIIYVCVCVCFSSSSLSFCHIVLDSIYFRGSYSINIVERYIFSVCCEGKKLTGTPHTYMCSWRHTKQQQMFLFGILFW